MLSLGGGTIEIIVISFSVFQNKEITRDVEIKMSYTLNISLKMSLFLQNQAMSASHPF
jgi:hypothetical protein